jgi:hypothetical protein
MYKSRVSVIVPVYNGARFLAETLRTALDQTLPPYEVIVIDDGSADESAAIAESIPGVRCIRRPNRGVAQARNHGLGLASGEFVVFLDHDDRLTRDALEVGVEALGTRPDAGFAYGRSIYVGTDGRPLPMVQLPDTPAASYLTLLSGDSLVPPACAIFRREAVISVGGFRKEAGLTEDYDLYLRVARRFPIHCHNRVVADYRLHETNTCNMNVDRLIHSMKWTLAQQSRSAPLDAETERVRRAGWRHWLGVLGPPLSAQVLAKVKHRRYREAASDALLLLRYYPRGVFRIAGDSFAKLGRVVGGRLGR